MTPAEEARKRANEVVRAKPEFQSIVETIEKAKELGEVSCEYSCGDGISARVQEVLEEDGYSFDYNKFTFYYTITW